MPIYNPGDPSGGNGNPGGCTQDATCNPGGGSAYVCARDESCWPATEVHTIHVTWTVSGQPANAASCANASDLSLMFGTVNDPGYYDFGFAPVPCAEGEFTIDKLPIQYVSVALIREYDQTGGASGALDGSGDVTLDLPY